MHIRNTNSTAKCVEEVDFTKERKDTIEQEESTLRATRGLVTEKQLQLLANSNMKKGEMNQMQVAIMISSSSKLSLSNYFEDKLQFIQLQL